MKWQCHHIPTTKKESKWPWTVLQHKVTHGERSRRKTLILYMPNQIHILEQLKRFLLLRVIKQLCWFGLFGGFLPCNFISNFIVKSRSLYFARIKMLSSLTMFVFKRTSATLASRKQIISPEATAIFFS